MDVRKNAINRYVKNGQRILVQDEFIHVLDGKLLVSTPNYLNKSALRRKGHLERLLNGDRDRFLVCISRGEEGWS